MLPAAPLLPLLVAYSIGPWLGVMLTGYLMGPWFRLPLLQHARAGCAGAGLLVLLFAGLRATNWYDLLPWSVQPRGPLYSALSFPNVTKYLPSLRFRCLTLGVALLLLSATERATGRLAQALRAFGQVPSFYFLLHLLLNSGGAWVWTRLAFGCPMNFSFAAAKDLPAAYLPSLLRAYAVWVAVVAMLCGPCR